MVNAARYHEKTHGGQDLGVNGNMGVDSPRKVKRFEGTITHDCVSLRYRQLLFFCQILLTIKMQAKYDPYGIFSQYHLIEPGFGKPLL